MFEDMLYLCGIQLIVHGYFLCRVLFWVQLMLRNELQCLAKTGTAFRDMIWVRQSILCWSDLVAVLWQGAPLLGLNLSTDQSGKIGGKGSTNYLN